MKKTGVLIALFLFFSTVPVGMVQAASHELGFDTALERMVLNNESLRAVSMEKRAREHDKAVARGLYMPKVKVNATYTRLDDDITVTEDDFEITGIDKEKLVSGIEDVKNKLIGAGLLPPTFKANLPGVSMTVQDEEFFQSNINASWPVYTGGRISAANRAAGIRVEEAGEKMTQTRAALTGEMVRRYYGLRLYMKIRDVRLEVLEGMEKHLHEAKILEQTGMISKAERLHAEVARSEALRLLKGAERDLSIAQTALKNTLCDDTDEGIIPTSPLFLTRNVGVLSELKRSAIANNPMLKRVTSKQELAEQNVRKEKAGMLPEVFLFGTREIYSNALSAQAPDWVVGVGMNISIFEGMAVKNRISAARDLRTQVDWVHSKAERDIQTLTEKSYHEVMKNMEQYDALGDSIALAREALRVQTRAFEEGYATSMDVVDARMTLSGVKIKQLTAVYYFDVALCDLLEAGGISQQFNQYRSDENVEVTF